MQSSILQSSIDKINMRIAITGATGLLGSNFLLEVIKRNINSLQNLKLVIFGKSKNNISLEKRIRNIIFDEEGKSYLDIYNIDSLNTFFLKNIIFIDLDLDDENSCLDRTVYKSLNEDPIDFFFHIASRTDFRSSPEVRVAVNRTNTDGTRKILNLVSQIKVLEFIYIGSAYACGRDSGIIAPDYINLNSEFRNPYELSKLQAEILVRDFSKRCGVRCRFFRPATICGRLIEKPLGATNKFDVFYSWLAWFLRMKIKHKSEKHLIYENKVRLDLRVAFNNQSGLNIVPADFIAKVIYEVCMQGDKGESYYLVNRSETPHRDYITWMLNYINIDGVSFVGEIPNAKNKIENFYYKTVGLIFTPYIDSNPMLFDTSNLDSVLRKAKLHCPPINESNFKFLLDYARRYDFGLFE